MQADSQEQGRITVLFQAVQGDIPAEADSAPDFSAHLLDHFDLAGQDIARQTVLGDAVPHHAAWLGLFFEDGDLISFFQQIIGGGDAGWPGTDDRNLLPTFFSRNLRDIKFSLFFFVVTKETMQFPDGQRLVDLGTGALSFAGVMADSAADAGKRVILLEQFQRLVISAVIDQCHETLDADMGRTGCLAGSGATFGYSESTGDSLRILFEDRLAIVKALIVFVRTGNRADLGALAATRALALVYITGGLMNLCGEIARLAFDTQYLGVRQELNIQMTADLDQFG